MIRNYIKIGLRNILKNKGYAVINILGLSMGVAACILIGLYIKHELTFDQYVEDAQEVYRLYTQGEFNGKLQKDAWYSANTAPTLKQDVQEIEQSGRLMDNPLFPLGGENEISFENSPNQFHEDRFAYADAQLMEILDIPFVFGSQATALIQPKSIVISKSKADKYFPDTNPIGQVVYLNGNKNDPFQIGGVMEDLPSNSHLNYDFFITLTDVEFGKGEQTRWLQNNYYTYIKAVKGTDYDLLENKVSNILIYNYIVPALREAGYNLADEVENTAEIKLMPIQDIHLYTRDIADGHSRGDIRFVWIFGLVGVFLIIIASINFINLSTAKAANRAKEVGLRKVVGSTKKNLIFQFLAESVLVSTFAFVLGVILSFILLPYFNKIAGLEIDIPILSNWFIPVLFLGSVFIGIMAGLYPSFYISAFKPKDVLKGKIRMGAKSSTLRSGLVVFQFTIALILIGATFIIQKQLTFILNSNLGYTKDQVVQIYGTNMLGDKVVSFKEKLNEIPGITSTSISDYIPIEGTKRNGNSFWNEGREKIDDNVSGQAWIIDDSYLNTFGIELLEGRSFDESREDDKQSTIVNQAMVDQLNLENPIGKNISRNGVNYRIIGVVKDFNFQDVTAAVRPLAFFYGISNSITSIKVNSGDISNTLATVESIWKEFAPYMEFRMNFMDESFEEMYAEVTRLKSLFAWFSGLTILIACLGLFTLSAFLSEQRKKEMSIRKVLGATSRQIFALLSRQFFNLILIALFIATPLTIYFMNEWLKDYEYKINLTWHPFFLTGVLAMIIMIITIGFHAVKTSLTNPVNNLKNE